MGRSGRIEELDETEREKDTERERKRKEKKRERERERERERGGERGRERGRERERKQYILFLNFQINKFLDIIHKNDVEFHSVFIL